MVGYVFWGILMSPDIVSLMSVVNQEFSNMYKFIMANFDYVTHVSLAFIAFTIGSELYIKTIRRLGKIDNYRGFSAKVRK